ncbi:MAG: hypothetical protein HYY06_33120 [Deltaproteobacteria bacterium]|nr:hypothetical protein [Deltaproteobacteria bacterium]
MSLVRESIDARLARLREATEDLAPPPGLADRLARVAISPEGSGSTILEEIWRLGRRVVLIAAVASAASVFLAGRADERVVEDLMAAAEAGAVGP